jgi:hypothetical protein
MVVLNQLQLQYTYVFLKQYPWYAIKIIDNICEIRKLKPAKKEIGENPIIGQFSLTK